MIKRKNWIKLISLLIISVISSLVLIKYGLIDVAKIETASNDFHYNAISMSSIIGGFLFTGISILISTIDKERIKRLWDNNYLDNLYRSAFVGMISNIITIIVALAYLICNLTVKLQKLAIYVEIVSLFVGLVYFVWCIKFLISIITKLKE